VHRSYRLRARPRKLVGGGDTDFAPALAEAERHRDLDGVVYFTDGRGPMPEARPRVPMLWVLTHDEPFEAPIGAVIRLPSITRR
jgi:predicted metal-dependent peptidase